MLYNSFRNVIILNVNFDYYIIPLPPILHDPFYE